MRNIHFNKKYTLILCICSGLFAGCARIRYGRLPFSPPIASCSSLSYKQSIGVLRLFGQSVPSEYGQPSLGNCRDQCGFILYTRGNDPEFVRQKVGDTVAGWPVCVQAGVPTLIGVDLRAAPTENERLRRHEMNESEKDKLID